jgi:hypothetical protein
MLWFRFRPLEIIVIDIRDLNIETLDAQFGVNRLLSLDIMRGRSFLPQGIGRAGCETSKRSRWRCTAYARTG